MARPEFVKCIRHSHRDRAGTSWCGRNLNLEMEWAFLDIDHAALNGLREDRLLACNECSTMAIDALKKGTYRYSSAGQGEGKEP